jgi:hypothetical protein
MLLSQYLTITQSLIQTPASPVPLLTTDLLTLYINIARGQVAGQGECIPAFASLTVTNSDFGYAFSALTFAESDMIAGALSISKINYFTAAGAWKRVTSRDWPWFNDYVVAASPPVSGPPSVWSQYRQGAQGIFYINPLDTSYDLMIDTIAYPVDLVDDTTVDAIPYLWTDAVPFYAAYYAYMAMQRQADADHMFQRFQELMGRARMAVTPSVLPTSYPQGPDPMLPNRLGVHPAAQRGAPTAQGAGG